jgi:hypothetical protein
MNKMFVIREHLRSQSHYGIKTYLLRARQMPVNPSDLLAGDELIPCICCELECVVEECNPLMDWTYQLAIVQHTD